MASPLGAVIDGLTSEPRELVAVNPPADDEPLTDVLAYFERFDVSAVRRVDAPALPDGTLVVTDGERCLTAADLGDLHAYLFDPGVAGDDPSDLPEGWLGDRDDSRPGGDGLTAATVDTVQQFLARLDNRVYTVTAETKIPMIGVSRHIEQRALGASSGTVHAGFQQLSRLRDRRHTLEPTSASPTGERR